MKKIKEIWNKFDNFVSKNDRRILIGIMLIQFIFFIVLLCFNGGPIIAVDSKSYIEPAKDFIANGTMCDGEGPTLYRTPGYILFLAFVYALTNYSNWVVVILQILMCLGVTYIIHYLIREMSGSKTLGCLGSFFYICDMAVYRNALCILTDVLFQFLLVLSLLLLYKYTKAKKYKDIFFMFLCLNYALAVRPQLMYFSMVLIVVLFVLMILKKIDFKTFITFAIMFSITYFGWCYRNYVIYGLFTYTPIRERDYFLWYATATYAKVNNVTTGVAEEELYKVLYAQYPNFDGMYVIDQIKAMSVIGREYCGEHFFAFILTNFDGLFQEMFGPNIATIQNFNLSHIAELLIELFVSGMLTLSYLIYAVCFLSSITRLKWMDWTIFLTVCYLMISTASVGHSRYRLAFHALCLIGTFTAYKSKTKEI